MAHALVQSGWERWVCFPLISELVYLTYRPFLSIQGIGAFYGSTNKDESFKMLTFAADRGVTFWDTSDVYGDSGFTYLTFKPVSDMI